MEQKPDLTKKLSEAMAEYQNSAEALASADQEVSMARNREADARNRCDRAQAAIDDLVKQMKADAPRDSAWQRDRTPKHWVKCA